MPTVTQSYGNITTDRDYPLLALGDGYFIKLSPMSLRDYLDNLDVPFRDITFPDFIVTSKEGALSIQGILTVLNSLVCVVPLMDKPIPTEDEDLGAVFLVTVTISNVVLKTLVDRIPPIMGGYDINTTYILIHNGE